MEIGEYLDFHSTDDRDTDYNVRMVAYDNGTLDVIKAAGQPATITANLNGTATNADYLNFTVGNEINFTGTPTNNIVYFGYRNTSVNEYKFNNGNGSGGLANVRANKFIGSLDGNANTATKATGVTDYKDAGRIIEIGWAGDGLNTSNLTHIAGYTDNGTKIKDVSKDVLKSWLGVNTIISQTSDPGAGSSLATGTVLLVYA